MIIAGFDIGGTKCASILADADESNVKFISRVEIATAGGWRAVLDKLCENISGQAAAAGVKLAAGGVACGGPLNSKQGLVLSPPNLPDWDRVPVAEIIGKKLNIKVKLLNDADAGAVAEHKFGAGRGRNNIVFLTFGTGLGAGLILNGRLYSGTNDAAGEAGHIRLSENGPVGYGKAGSFDGFCSGQGIKQLGQTTAAERFQQGMKVSYCKDIAAMDAITAKGIALCAEKGEKDALAVYEKCGEYFGRGLSVLIDILNPEMIIAGGVFMRSNKFLVPAMERALKREALPASRLNCKIVPSMLGEQIGDYAAIAAAFS